MDARKIAGMKLLSLSVFLTVKSNNRELSEFMARFGRILDEMVLWIEGVIREREKREGTYDGRN